MSTFSSKRAFFCPLLYPQHIEWYLANSIYKRGRGQWKMGRKHLTPSVVQHGAGPPLFYQHSPRWHSGLLKPWLWTYYNLTINKIHIVLPSHMFTIYTGTSSNPYPSKVSSFLDGPIPPAWAEVWALNQAPTEHAHPLQVSCYLDQDTIQVLSRAHVSVATTRKQSPILPPA